jgi:hypothetical protein
MADKNKDFFKVAVFEREEHKVTLKLLEEFAKRAATHSAGGYKTTAFCKVCERVPAGVSGVQWRASCPCRQAPERIASALERLAKPLRLHEPTPDTDKPGAV